MPHRRAAWRTIFLTYPCPTCGVPAGHPCTTTNTNGTTARDYVHADRGRTGDRCATCHALLPHGATPADLCARCAQVRALEVERATKHIRRDP